VTHNRQNEFLLQVLGPPYLWSG